MFKQTYISNKIALLATLAILPLLAACGDEGDSGGKKSSDDSGSGGGGALVCVAYLLVSGDDECISWITSSSSSSGSSTIPIKYVLNYDYEPNNDLLNAIPLNIETTTSPDGFQVPGKVNAARDPADTFSFARPTSRNFRFKLCADGNHACNEYGEIDTLTAYIDVLNSSGNVVASSQAASRNVVETRITSGSTYYVRVVAADTMGATVDYGLYGNEYE